MSQVETITLTDGERAVYEWQLDVPGFGENGQERLKGASVLVSRVGGLGSVVAYELAAAGVGRLVLAHAGNIKPSDLNRQLLMTPERLGTERVRCARERLQELNPRLQIDVFEENLSRANASRIIGDVDLVVDCAPMFEERLAMNEAIVERGIPMVDCAMYELEFRITTILPGRTPCLACLTPEPPPAWKRRFPVFGAVSGTVGCLGAMEAVKVLSKLGKPLFGRMLTMDLRTMKTRTFPIARRSDCAVCGNSALS
ncbi:MAG: ThiF family adenylyltransferase [Opitutales bacterium]